MTGSGRRSARPAARSMAWAFARGALVTTALAAPGPLGPVEQGADAGHRLHGSGEAVAEGGLLEGEPGGEREPRVGARLEGVLPGERRGGGRGRDVGGALRVAGQVEAGEAGPVEGVGLEELHRAAEAPARRRHGAASTRASLTPRCVAREKGAELGLRRGGARAAVGKVQDGGHGRAPSLAGFASARSAQPSLAIRAASAS